MTANESASSRDYSSLSSSDLISRFLAATPSYLYNAPPIQQNFFFSEMLRSFLPLKNDAISSNNNIRRRKRSWKDSRDRPLELTINKKINCQYHSTTQTSTSQYQQNYQELQNNRVQQHPLVFQNHNILNLKHSLDQHLQSSAKRIQTEEDNNQTLNNKLESTNITETEDKEMYQSNQFMKKYYLERLPSNSLVEPLLDSTVDKKKTDNFENSSTNTNCIDNSLLYSKSMPIDNTVFSLKNKSEFDTKNIFSKIASRSENFYPPSNFRLPNSQTSDFSQKPLWPSHYSFAQTYPTVDPFHFFIDLRVSGHIWDRSNNEKNIFSRNKRTSAFDVPKEYYKPLNLTRNEITSIRPFNKCARGTHDIFKNIQQTYQRIWIEENIKKNTSNENINIS